MAPQEASKTQPFPWHLGAFDAHCHPTDTAPSLDKIAGMKTRALTIMATRGQDQRLVADFADKLAVTDDAIPALESTRGSEKSRGYIIPAFGWHPWFSHQIFVDEQHRTPSKVDHYRLAISPSPVNDDFIASLPDPRPLSDLLGQTRTYLERYPRAIVGEIGLDRAFRIPGIEMADNGYEKDPALTPGGREGRRLSTYRVDMRHQQRILKAQLNLAGEMQRAVSVHGVAAHGLLFETLEETWRGHERRTPSKRERKRRASVDATHQKGENFEAFEQSSDLGDAKPFPPRICLHSYSGPADTLRQYLQPSVPAIIFFSFSRLVNFSSTSTKAVAAIQALPDDRILAESDLHAAGDKMDDLLEDIVRKICQIKGWTLEEGVKQLRLNWLHYIFGKNLEKKDGGG
ncbi:hypothetical protein IMSHALPRED_010685 [Imshaugia aleurites]|uniref:Cut9 interacting protein Scn1 n=1 Tax=Imshaugia aleurites TaxID=172621 RepID=A0A8H3I952_9LECA|nr:hypothetical protein IMSHALPRED_010685 [Imshaugia aleurites]